MSEKKRVNRYFHGAPKARLIVTVEGDILSAVDELISDYAHHCHRNRAEFVRQAIAEKLAHDSVRK